MKPSEDFVKNVQATCEAEMKARTKSLQRFVNERVACRRPEVAELALGAYRDAVAAHAVRHLLTMMATFPNDFPERSAMSVLDGIIGGLDHETLTAIADDAIHPTIDKLH